MAIFQEHVVGREALRDFILAHTISLTGEEADDLARLIIEKYTLVKR